MGIVRNYIVIHYADSSCQLLAVTMGRRNKLVYPCRVEGWLNVCGKFIPVSSLHFMDVKKPALLQRFPVLIFLLLS